MSTAVVPLWRRVATQLFGADHDLQVTGTCLSGTAHLDGQPLTVVGTTDHAAVDLALALDQAAVVLRTVREHPGRPLLLMIDTQGQALRRRDEMLGLNRGMAHLGLALALARRQGHRVIGLVYGQALSGGFITSGLMADACYALPQAEIRVMGLPAMARITKLPQARLEALATHNPVFAPGVQNFVAMGGVRAVWRDDLAACLRTALAEPDRGDQRADDAEARGGRRCAAPVTRRVLAPT